MVLSGFVERVGDPVPLVAADGSSHQADRLLVRALEAMVHTSGGQPSAAHAGNGTPDIVIAVPAHCGGPTLRALNNSVALAGLAGQRRRRRR